MRIENYLGFPTGLTGAELTDRATLQANKFGAHLSIPTRGDPPDVRERICNSRCRRSSEPITDQVSSDRDRRAIPTAGRGRL